jgi:biotin transport system substrate-specific component
MNERQNGRTVLPAGALEPRSWRGFLVRPEILEFSLVAAGVGILAAGAWLSVPFYPVPLTMQTLAVLLVGGLLGPRLGTAAVFSYLALGAAGAPVFHNGLGGPVVLLGPTGGYLLGFLPAAFLMGLAARRVRTVGSGRQMGSVFGELAVLVAGALLAETAIYAFGVPWLAAVYTGGSLSRAVAVGAFPYFLGDLLKITVAVGALRLGTKASGRWGSLIP